MYRLTNGCLPIIGAGNKFLSFIVKAHTFEMTKHTCRQQHDHVKHQQHQQAQIFYLGNFQVEFKTGKTHGKRFWPGLVQCSCIQQWFIRYPINVLGQQILIVKCNHQGPPVAGKIRRELSSLLAKSPFSTLQEAVGANHRANNAFQSCKSDDKKL